MTDRPVSRDAAPPRPGVIQIAALSNISGRRAIGVIILLSVVVIAFLTWLVYLKPRPDHQPAFVSALPTLNAILNATSAILLICGYRAIRRRAIGLHVRFMLCAFLSSAAFFLSYVLYHHFHGDTKFGNRGPAWPVYLFILITHIGLSVVAVPLILSTFYLGLGGKFRVHRTLARLTLPVWLYVSITGVIIFIMLKVFSP